MWVSERWEFFFMHRWFCAESFFLWNSSKRFIFALDCRIMTILSDTLSMDLCVETDISSLEYSRFDGWKGQKFISSHFPRYVAEEHILQWKANICFLLFDWDVTQKYFFDWDVAEKPLFGSWKSGGETCTNTGQSLGPWNWRRLHWFFWNVAEEALFGTWKSNTPEKVTLPQ